MNISFDVRMNNYYNLSEERCEIINKIAREHWNCEFNQNLVNYFSRNFQLFDFCYKSKAQISFDPIWAKLPGKVQFEIAVNGAKNYVARLVKGLGISNKEATDYLLDGKFEPLDFIPKEFKHLRDIDPDDCQDDGDAMRKAMFGSEKQDKLLWLAARWYMNKKDNSGWNSVRIMKGLNGESYQYRLSDLVDEIRVEHLINGWNTSLDVVAEQLIAGRMKDAEKAFLKNIISFPECPIKGNDEFRQIRTSLELAKEGERFGNCLYLYTKDCLSGSSFIFTSKNMCVEVAKSEKSIKYGRRRWYIVQCKTFHNEEPDAADRAACEKWFEEACKAMNKAK